MTAPWSAAFLAFFTGAVMAAGVVPVVFYKALRSKLVYPDQASAAAVPVYYNRAQDALPFPATIEPGGLQAT